MIDDALVEKAKIGGSNYFWSFKAKKDRLAQIQHETTMKLIEELKPKMAEAEARLSDAKRGREEDDEDNEVGRESSKDDGEEREENDAIAPIGGRANKLARLTEVGKQKTALEAELEKLKENDPATLADLGKELQLVTQVRMKESIKINSIYLSAFPSFRTHLFVSDSHTIMLAFSTACT